MGSFKKISDTGHLKLRYFKRAIVYLESAEDFLIIKDRWFHNEGELLEFKSADVGLGGGASQVISNVDRDRAGGAVAFGLVDRDALLAKTIWDAWWERDDEKFSRMRPLGEAIRVLTKWEIENYLLDPDIIEEERANLEGRQIDRENAVARLAGDVLEPARMLAAASVIMHKQGGSLGNDLDKVVPLDALRAKVQERLWADADELARVIDHIESFGENHPLDSDRYWDRISRILDGKRILKRIGLAQNSLDVKADYRLSLASKIRQTGKIAPEFVSYIEEFKSAARQAI